MPVKILWVTPMNASLGAHGEHVRYVKNAMPVAGNYRPRPKQTLGDDLALGAPANALHVHVYPTGMGGVNYSGDAKTVFAGTQTQLWEVTQTTKTDVSRAALYAQGIGDVAPAWSFASFGDQVIASNMIDEMQVQATRGADFANLITSAFKPQARHIAVVRTSLMGANLDSAGGTRFSDEYSLSVPGNAASHDPAGGAFQQRSVFVPGQITGLVGGEFARIFKANGMAGINFTGSSVVPWREDPISTTVGALYGRSIVELQGGVGEVAFFGGDSFYRQAGMDPPVRIGPQLLPDFLEYRTYEPTLHPLAPLRLLTYPIAMPVEDAILFGARCARSGCILWVYRPNDEELDAGSIHGLLWDPVLDLWSFQEFPANVACLASYPDRSGASYFGGIVGLDCPTFGTTNRWFRFDSATAAECYVRWGAQALAWNDQGGALPVKIKGVLPLFTWRGAAAGSTPPDVTVTVTAYDDPYLRDVTGGQPREAPMAVSTHANEWGWMNEPVLGEHIAIEMGLGETTALLQAFRAVVLDYEVVA